MRIPKAFDLCLHHSHVQQSNLKQPQDSNYLILKCVKWIKYQYNVNMKVKKHRTNNQFSSAHSPEKWSARVDLSFEKPIDSSSSSSSAQEQPFLTKQKMS